MTTATLDALMETHRKMADLLTQLAAAPTPAPAITTLTLPGAAIELQAGERYAGLVLADGQPSHHLILLPGQADDVDWDQANHWAKEAGGVLPTRQEQALLYANAKDAFEGAWYWSAEEHTNGSYAWSQYFYYGHQYYDVKSYEARARAVRRFKA